MRTVRATLDVNYRIMPGKFNRGRAQW